MVTFSSAAVGVWEGEFALPSHPGPLTTVSIEMSLVQNSEGVVGTAKVTNFGDPSFASQRVISVFGSCSGQMMTLYLGAAARVIWRLSGVIEGDAVDGVGVYVLDGVDTYSGTFRLTRVVTRNYYSGPTTTACPAH